jgi:hypothetical protein
MNEKQRRQYRKANASFTRNTVARARRAGLGTVEFTWLSQRRELRKVARRAMGKAIYSNRNHDHPH